MKRTVIKYNKIAHERAIAKINAIRRIIDDFKDAYAKFQDDTEMENLDQGAMIAIMEDGRRVLERMIDAYVAKQPKPLRSYYSEAFYGALNEHLDPILNKVMFWKDQQSSAVFDDYFPYELTRPKNWPWKDLTLAPDDAFFEKIRPHYELSISSELDHQLFEKYTALAAAYNELLELALQNDVRIPMSFTELFRLQNVRIVPKVSLQPDSFLPSQTNKELEEKYGGRK